ncbi:SDR family oxidoreductase [Oceanicoccus sp. KOV_DT_Chl]|uniref:SDR family NAD(P)-dependent oxidoreductase n=1 Tax=Oceanicoccus sp. KOV_DT_Chl TaxID=1904639 RepID=UPI000C7CE68E|nr:SDR family NAD(P)-dependent oxidoreductase [Oceanicoccus sp. KOV_DT_Chl]
MFTDKTVIITGASAGVGASCARTFAGLGANLVLVARGAEALEKMTKELSPQVKVLALTIDVADQQACTDLVKQCLEYFGKIDILVNNAGLHHRGDFSTRSPRELSAMVDVNLRAPVQLTSECLPYLLQSGGAVIMVGSLAGRAPLQGASIYAATKAAVRSFAYSLDDELRGSGVHVGVVSVGPIDTGFIMNDIDQVEDIVFSQGMSSPQQVADAVVSIARGDAVEICLPRTSALLTSVGYFFPGLRRFSRGFLYWLGRKKKQKYRQG